MSKTYSVPPAAPANHGATLAAWSLTVGVVLGAIMAAFGLVLGNPVLMVIGAVVILAGIVVSVALRLAGFGQKQRGTLEK